jgi:hypothetical protein
MDEIKALKLWLKKPGNSAAQIAVALGYKSSVVVNQWIHRGRIPQHQIHWVMKFIKTGEGPK